MIPLKPYYFMRHGQTDYNKTHRCIGSLDIPLNPNGEQQAHDALESFQGVTIDRIISRPLKRAYKTAEIVAEHYNLSIHAENLLKEASWGELEGQPRANEDMFTLAPRITSKRWRGICNG